MHGEVQVVVAELPEHIISRTGDLAKVMLAIWVVVRCERVKLLHSRQDFHSGNIAKHLNALCDHNTTIHEGLPCVIIKCCYFCHVIHWHWLALRGA